MKQTKHFFVLSLALVLAGQGCLPGAGAPAPAPDGSAGGGSGSSGGSVSGDCSHPYMPLRPGSSITYTSSGAGDGSTYTQTVASNSGSEATLNYSFEGQELTLDYTLNCSGDGIFAEGYLDFGSVMAGSQIRTETRSASGPFLPDDLDVGTSWNNHFEMVVTYTDPSFPISEATQIMDISRRATGRERVTVPAGTFDALVVEASFNLNNDAFPTGPITFTQTEHWVEGVGLVRTAGADPGGGSTVTEAVSVVR